MIFNEKRMNKRIWQIILWLIVLTLVCMCVLSIFR